MLELRAWPTSLHKAFLFKKCIQYLLVLFYDITWFESVYANINREAVHKKSKLLQNYSMTYRTNRLNSMHI